MRQAPDVGAAGPTRPGRHGEDSGESYFPLTDQSQWTYRIQAIASTSDGVNWTWNQAPGNSPLYDIRALPDGDYVAVGASGTLLRGNPESGWKPADAPAGVFTWLSASDFDPAGHGVAGGGHGLLLTTSDFGKKWEWKANG